MFFIFLKGLYIDLKYLRQGFCSLMESEKMPKVAFCTDNQKTTTNPHIDTLAVFFSVVLYTTFQQQLEFGINQTLRLIETKQPYGSLI